MTDSSRCSLNFHKVAKTGAKVLENEKADETRIVRECFHSRFAWFSGFFTIVSIKERILSISDNPPNMVSFHGVTNLFHPFTACIFVSFHK